MGETEVLSGDFTTQVNVRNIYDLCVCECVRVSVLRVCASVRRVYVVCVLCVRVCVVCVCVVCVYECVVCV